VSFDKFLRLLANTWFPSRTKLRTEDQPDLIVLSS